AVVERRPKRHSFHDLSPWLRRYLPCFARPRDCKAKIVTDAATYHGYLQSDCSTKRGRTPKGIRPGVARQGATSALASAAVAAHAVPEMARPPPPTLRALAHIDDTDCHVLGLFEFCAPSEAPVVAKSAIK